MKGTVLSPVLNSALQCKELFTVPLECIFSFPGWLQSFEDTTVRIRWQSSVGCCAACQHPQKNITRLLYTLFIPVSCTSLMFLNDKDIKTWGKKKIETSFHLVAFLTLPKPVLVKWLLITCFSNTSFYSDVIFFNSQWCFWNTARILLSLLCYEEIKSSTRLRKRFNWVCQILYESTKHQDSKMGNMKHGQNYQLLYCWVMLRVYMQNCFRLYINHRIIES